MGGWFWGLLGGGGGRISERVRGPAPLILMKASAWILALALGIAGPAIAVVVDFEFRYDKVQLKNGRSLEDVVFKTYNTANERVTAVTGKRQAMSVRLADLPEEIVARIKERVPVLTEQEASEDKTQVKESRQEAKTRAREIEKRAAVEVKANRDAQRRLDVGQAAAARAEESRQRAEVARAARTLASHYFTYEADPYSSVGYVFGSNIILEDPEPVAGWSNRWRVKGKVGIQYLTRDAGAVGRNTKDFELLIDAPAKGKPKLVDVTISRM